MALVTAEDVTCRLDPRPDPSQDSRIDLLIGDAEEIIRDEFARRRRDLDEEMVVTWVGNTVRRVIREMVSAAIIIGPNAGLRTVASTTGPQSDSVTYADVDAVSFGGVRLTNAQREALGLPVTALPRGTFPRPSRWPEVTRRG